VERSLEAALASTLLVLAFRAMPFVLYVAMRPGRRWLGASFALLAYAGLLITAEPEARRVLAWSAVGLLYYAAVACLVHWVSKETGQVRGVDAALLFGMLAALFLGAPATILRPIALGTFQALGWELTFKAYSYVVEGGARAGSLRACLFFLLVDPTVVFPRGARPIAGASPVVPAAIRVALGTLSVLAYFLLLIPATALASLWPAQGGQTWVVPAVIGYGFVQLLSTYCQHSGVASIQIGLLRLCGFSASERYNYPLLARSPADFWRRWNTYVGEWIKRYVYTPITLRMTRGFQGFMVHSSAAWAAALGVLIAFAATGALHDLYFGAQDHAFAWSWTAFFMVNAALLLLWEGAARAIRRPEWRLTAVDRFALFPRVAFGVAFAFVIGAAS
jgi:hypothetical protein